MLQIGSQGDAGPQLVGIPFILPALASAFLGTTISGLSLIGIQPWITNVFNGSAVVLAIAMPAQLRKRRTGTLDIGS